MKEPRLSLAASWLSLGASFVLSFATWVALAQLAGYGDAVSYAMPFVVDGYIVTSLVLWLSPVRSDIATLAKRHTYGAALIGVAVQSGYHGATVWDDTGVIWRAVVAAVVGALPPLFAALAVHMRALVRRESDSDIPQVKPVVAPVATVTRDIADVFSDIDELFASRSDIDSDMSHDVGNDNDIGNLLKAGLSPRAIAPLVGKSKRQVERIQKSLRESGELT